FLLMFGRRLDAAFSDVALGANISDYGPFCWFRGPHEVDTVILRALALVSEIGAASTCKRLFGYTAMVFATMLIAFLGFMVWARHMFTVGLGPVANSIFAVGTMAIAIPTGIKIFNWILTMWGGQVTVNSAMLWALGFIPSLT